MLDEARLYGVDFTSAPSPRKPITVASLVPEDAAQGAFRLDELCALPTFDAFDTFLRRPGPWIAALDLPFGLPRELVRDLGWPTEYRSLIAHYRSQSRAELRALFSGYCAGREVGNKFARRATDGPAGSSSSMKWVNPPVAWMLHAGVPALLDANVTVYGHCENDPSRIALEGYPGLLARGIERGSYKNDSPKLQTSDRRDRRTRMVQRLLDGENPLGITVRMNDATVSQLIDDARGDWLDAVFCATQAAYAWQRRDDGFGLPPSIDPIEGWILTAPF